MEELKDIIKRGQELLAKLENKPKTGRIYSPDELEEGDFFYFIGPEGCILEYKYYNSKLNGVLISLGQTFHDEKSCLLNHKRNQALIKWERLAKEAWGDTKIDWGYDRRAKCYLREICGDYEIYVTHEGRDQGTIFFPSEKSIQKARDEIGEDIKYLFNE